MKINHNSLFTLLMFILGLAISVFASGCIAASTPPAASPDVKAADPLQAAFMEGPEITPEAAKKLEDHLSTEPDDVAARTQLIAYYMFKSMASPATRAKFQKHILYVIEHHPKSAIAGAHGICLDPKLDGDAFTKGKALWLKQVKQHPGDTTILGNAASFLRFGDREEAEKLLRTAQAVDPKNPEWHARIADLYESTGSATGGKMQQEAAKRSFLEKEAAYRLATDNLQKFYALRELAKLAYNVGEFDKARLYARDMLLRARGQRTDWNYGNAIHDGNMVLGRLALRAGRLHEARAYLLAAGKTPGSPQLDTFGPNMTLARDLLQKGERKVVLQYFEECRKFWEGRKSSPGGKDKLDEWAAEVKKGKSPDFGANLDY